MRKPKPFSDQLRDALRRADRTRYRIAKETGISQSVLSRFLRGAAGLSMLSADKLVEALDLELVKRKGR
jgi:transcriptional regulator with XRE-family HTH domain